MGKLTHPSISPDRSLITYTKGDPASLESKVAIMNFDGTDNKDITNKKNQFGAIPTFSRDGKFITFAAWHHNVQKGTYTLPQIVYCDLNGENQIMVTSNNYENWRPVFSEDSRSIIYISHRNGNYDIYKYDIDSQKEINITNTPYDEWDPNISNDGNKIVFAANKDGNWDLFEMDRYGRNRKQLTFTEGNEWDPSYSPDGKRIVFAGEFGFNGGIYEYLTNSDDNIYAKTHLF